MIATYLNLLIVIFVLQLVPTESIKWWVENPEFQDSKNWKDGKTPCSKDKIVFPEYFSAAIFVPTSLKTNGIILPRDGILLLHTDSKILLENRGEIGSENCVNSDRLAKINNIKTRNWFNPGNWKEFPGMNQNAATPHVERIPCSNEEAIIGLNSAVSIDMDYVDELHVGGIHMGQKDLTSEELQYFFRTDLGQSIFKNAENTEVKFSKRQICGCHIQENVIEYEHKVCKFAKNTCEMPKCLNPIVPTGHCCSICGSYLKLHVNNCTSFNMNSFRKKLQAATMQEELMNEVHIDYRMVSDGDDDFLQLVIIDKDEYNEKGVKLMNILKENFLKNEYKHFKQTFHMSGLPYNPGDKVAGWIFMLLSLFGVLIFFIIIFVHFMPEIIPAALPSWLHPGRYQVFNSPFVFARFDNNQPEVEISGNILNVTNNGENQNVGRTTSFNNPMFDENAENEKQQGGPLETEMSEIELDESKQV